MQSTKKVFIIAGPTAVGKTAAAIALAKYLDTEIISADSRQCYRELNIGVARPSAAELGEVPHHFIATHSIHENVTAAVFEKYALAKLDELFQRADSVVITGGTGLYLRAIAEGLDPIPTIEHGLREKLNEQYEKLGMNWLYEEILVADPEFASRGEMKNPQRMLRALEVIKSTGQSILSFQNNARVSRPFAIEKLALDIPRVDLHERINNRVDQMMHAGLMEEVRNLLPDRMLNALITVGYKELFEYLDGNLTLTAAVEQIKAHTRQYARRQLTWFRNNGYTWFDARHFDPRAIVSK